MAWVLLAALLRQSSDLPVSNAPFEAGASTFQPELELPPLLGLEPSTFASEEPYPLTLGPYHELKSLARSGLLPKALP
jgi:hypothetical protein